MNLQDITENLKDLRKQCDFLEEQLKDYKKAEASDPIRTFDVVLRVTTRASTWWGGWVNKGMVFDQFLGKDFQEIVGLNDPGDSIKVDKVTEVEQNY